MNQSIALYVALEQAPSEPTAEACAWMEGADGLLIDPGRCTPEAFACMPVASALLTGGDPQRDAPWRAIAGHWIGERGLEETARLRDLYPELCWIPRLNVTRAPVGYRFSGPAIGEGFSFYMPDTSAIKTWRVTDSDLSLHENLARAAALGFEALWLHSPDAADRGRGLDLELLDTPGAGALSIWLSGGVCGSGHLRNLARVGGACAVVVDEAVARQASLAELRESLAPQTPMPEAVPVTFSSREAESGPR
jgi:hypothetical protein